MTTYLCELCFDALTTHVTAAWDGLETAVCDGCLAPPVGDAAWRDVAAMGRRAELETALAHFDTFAASVAAAYAQARQPAPERAGALGLASYAMSPCEQWQQALLNRAAMFAFQQQAYPSAFAYQQQAYALPLTVYDARDRSMREEVAQLQADWERRAQRLRFCP